MIALAALGLMSLSAFAQTPTPNEAARQATAQRVIAGETKCTGCDLFQVNLSYQELPGRDLSGSRLRQSDLSLATFDNGKFTGANLSIINGFGARFEDANLSGANLEEATLVGAWLGGATLTGANLSHANLSGAYLRTARGLTQSQLNTACGDASTELPKGMTLPACKAKGIELTRRVTDSAPEAPLAVSYVKPDEPAVSDRMIEPPAVPTDLPANAPADRHDPTPAVLTLPRTEVSPRAAPTPIDASNDGELLGARAGF